MDLHTSTKMIIELLQDSLHLDTKKKEKLQKISEKIEHKELDKSEKEFLTKLKLEMKDETKDVRELSAQSTIFTQKLLDRTLTSFGIVLILYILAFVVGLILIGVSLKLALDSPTTNEYLASFFGAAGVFDISFLLYKPAQQIQRSRGNATQLWMAFSEWLYISIWSGKTYHRLFTILENSSDQTILAQMLKILKIKAETTVNLIESIEKNVAARPDEKGTKKNGKNGEKNGTTNGSDDKNKKIKTSEQGKKKPGKQNSNGKKKDQNGGRHNEEHGGEHHGS